MTERVFSTSSAGIGGRIKQRILDFKVREITAEGKKCEITINDDELSDETLLKEIPENPDSCKYLHLTMQKFNLDVFEAIKRIARFTYSSPKRIGFAGMKDKRALTSQRISVFEPNIERLKQFGSKYVLLSDAEWRKKAIEIGDLKENEFEVTIRDISLGKEETGKKTEECFKEMEKGIANYFGEQRFGGARKVTPLVGREIIKGSLENAVMLYLTYTEGESEEKIKEARKSLSESGDFGKALKEFPLKYRYERAMLNHLHKNSEDFCGAFRVLPKSLRYLFVHSFQASLFNKIVEKRLGEGMGLKEEKGDVLIEGIPSAALFGFESVLAEGKMGEIEKSVLGEEGVELKDFFVREMKELSSKGSRKAIALFPKEMKLLGVAEDEFNEGKTKAVVSFSLTKGNYATTVLQELMKN